MTGPNNLKNATELIFLINTAINNFRLYPPTSELIMNAVGRKVVTNRQLSCLTKNIKKVQAVAALLKSDSESGNIAESDLFCRRAGILKTALNGMSKSQAMVSHERVMLDRMAETAENLLKNEKYSTVVTLFGQMGNLLLNKDPEIRKAAANLLSQIDEKFEAAGCKQERIPLSQKLMEWLRHETEFSPVYEKIIRQLETYTRALITHQGEMEALKILETVSQISSGSLKRERKIEETALKMLQNLAAEDILVHLLKNSSSGQIESARRQIGCLAILGAVNMDRLLDMLHDSQNRSERNRLIRVISEIGRSGAPAVAERLRQGGPWFYVRNLALLLGRIGSNADFTLLEELLKNKNPRIQREGVLAIQNIGGADAGKILYKNLYTVDDEVKSFVFLAIGALKYREPVPEMIVMLESSVPGKSRKAKTDVMASICEAFGRMGDERAVPVLMKIVRSKGFLTKDYDPTVKAAANEALSKIQSSSGTAD